MKKRMLILSFLIVALLIQPAFSKEKQAASEQQIGQWMSYYYLQRDVTSIHDYLRQLQDASFSKKNINGVLTGFLYVIFSDNKSQIEEFLKNTEFTGPIKDSIEKALWLSGNGREIKAIFKEDPERYKAQAPNLANLLPKSGEDLDLMWGAFSASGDVVYVKRIIDVLDDQQPLTANATIDKVTRYAADWSIGSNVSQHELIRRLVMQEIKTRPEPIKSKLEKIISDIESKKKPFPLKDGEFSADMIVISDKDLKEFDKPSDQGMSFTELKKAKRGNIVSTKIVFGGMELTDGLMADVTFDFKILGPDGKIYDGTDIHDSAALKGKVPYRFAVFDNQSFIRIEFEQKDMLGTYQIIAKVKDNVGKKEITLKKKVELVD
jgi:hypothetical protein